MTSSLHLTPHHPLNDARMPHVASGPTCPAPASYLQLAPLLPSAIQTGRLSVSNHTKVIIFLSGRWPHSVSAWTPHPPDLHGLLTHISAKPPLLREHSLSTHPPPLSLAFPPSFLYFVALTLSEGRDLISLIQPFIPRAWNSVWLRRSIYQYTGGRKEKKKGSLSPFLAPSGGCLSH